MNESNPMSPLKHSYSPSKVLKIFICLLESGLKSAKQIFPRRELTSVKDDFAFVISILDFLFIFMYSFYIISNYAQMSKKEGVR